MMEPMDIDDLQSPEAQALPESARTTRTEIRDTLKELLKHGLLESARKPNLYRVASSSLVEINAALEPIDLEARLDEIRGLAYLAVRPDAATTPDEEWSHPLIRKRRLTLEQSLLVAILRQQFVAYEQQAGSSSSDASLSLDDLLPPLQVYLGSLGSDALEQKRLRHILEALKEHGIVSEIDNNDRLLVRPIIAHLANPDSLKNLLETYRSAAKNGDRDSGKDTDA